MEQEDRDLLIKVSLDTQHIKDSLEDYKEITQGLDNTLRGNGGAGLVERVSVIESNDKRRGAQLMVILSGVVATIAGLLTGWFKTGN